MPHYKDQQVCCQLGLQHDEIASSATAGVAPNVLTYTTLMSACTRAGQWEKALQAFAKMEGAGLQPDVLAYNSAISACAAAGGWEKAWALFGSA